MAALTDLSDVVNRLTGGNSGTPETVFFFKDPRVDGAAASATYGGFYNSLWKYEGIPGTGATPTTVAIPTATTAGGLQQTNPGGGRQKWLVSFAGAASTPGALILYDRLLHIGGLDGTSITAQTVGGTITRYNTNGTCVGNQIWAEIYTTVGSTLRSIVASYTNQAGTSGQTSIGGSDFGGPNTNGTKNQMMPINLISGDTGVQAVASVTLSASTGTAGNFGITIVRPLAILRLPGQGTPTCLDLMTGMPGPIEILTDACLAMMWISNTTTVPRIFGSCQFIES